MKRRLVLLLSLLLVLLCTGCQDTKNDPENLKLIPYTFEGKQGDWQVQVELRRMSEEDLSLMPDIPDIVEREALLGGFRTEFHIRYSGQQEIHTLTYTFGTGTDFKNGGELESKEGMSLNALLDGEQDLGGAFHSEDASMGGPVPPKKDSYPFKLEGTYQNGGEFEVEMALQA